MLPTGIICLWSGAIGNIPAGWLLCNGANGTPDLRDRFIWGAGGTKNPGDSGGGTTHTHGFSGDGHNHTIPVGTDIAAGANYSLTTSLSTAIGTTNPGSSLPPYYALAYIMKT